MTRRMKDTYLISNSLLCCSGDKANEYLLTFNFPPYLLFMIILSLLKCIKILHPLFLLLFDRYKGFYRKLCKNNIFEPDSAI